MLFTIVMEYFTLFRKEKVIKIKTTRELVLLVQIFAHVYPVRAEAINDVKSTYEAIGLQINFNISSIYFEGGFKRKLI